MHEYRKRRRRMDSQRRASAWEWMSLLVQLLLLHCHPVQSHPQTAIREVCTQAKSGACRLCSVSELDSIPECKKTGRIQSFQCSTIKEGVELESRRKVESCKRTRADEDYLMVRLQIICLVVGCFSYMTVRKQRQMYATGFDQRKQFADTTTNNNNINNSSVSGGSTTISTNSTPSGTYSRSTSFGLDQVSTREERVPLSVAAGDDNSGIEVI